MDNTTLFSPDDAVIASKKRRSLGGHQSPVMSTDVWLTPPNILAQLGPFDLDPCACQEPRPWPTAARHICLPDNGLLVPWTGRVWLNPPFSNKAGAFLAKLSDHGNGIALVHARTDTDWFFRGVWEASSVAALLFLRGRIKFYHHDGRQADDNSGAPVVLVAYGSHNAVALRESGLEGRYVGLSPCH